MMKLKQVIIITEGKCCDCYNNTTYTHTHTHVIHLLTGERKLGDGFLDTSTASLEISCKTLKTRLKSRLTGGNTRLDGLGTLDSIHERALVIVQLITGERKLGIDLLDTATARLEGLSNALSTRTQSLLAIRNTWCDSFSTLHGVSESALVIAESFVEEEHLLGLLVTLNLTVKLGNARTACSPVRSKALSTRCKTLFAFRHTLGLWFERYVSVHNSLSECVKQYANN